MQRAGDEAAVQMLVADLLEQARGGTARAVALAGPRRRAAAALQLAQASGHPTLLVSASLDGARAAIQAAPALGRRVLLVSGALDTAELSLRLREIATAPPRLVAIEPERLWQARMLRALRAYGPRFVIVEVGGLAMDAHERRVRAGTVLRWARELFPTATLLALHQPVPPSVAARFSALSGARSESRGSLFPEQVAVRITLLEDERRRLASLLDALRAASGAALVIAPSRGKARSLAAALARSGIAAALYHGGLSFAERAAVLGAWREGRQQLLVATEAFAVVPDVPCPALIAFAHPPRSLDTLISLAERAEAAPGMVVALILHTAGDVEALSTAATANLPTLGRLRRLYATLRRQSTRGQVLLDPERLTADTGGQVARLDLELLVEAGYMLRRADFARAATITPAGDDLSALAPLGDVVALRCGVPTPVEPLQVAGALGWPAHRLHQWLLDAEDRGLLALRTVGREMLFTLRQHPPDGTPSLASIVDRLRRETLEDAAAVAALLDAPSCRLQALARALAWPAPAPCGRCDRCAPGSMPMMPSRAGATVAVLQALAAVPRGLPRGAAMRAARQALATYGGLADAADPAAALAALVARDLVAERQGELGTLLVVTEAGVRLLASGG